MKMKQRLFSVFSHFLFSFYIVQTVFGQGCTYSSEPLNQQGRQAGRGYDAYDLVRGKSPQQKYIN